MRNIATIGLLSVVIAGCGGGDSAGERAGAASSGLGIELPAGFTATLFADELIAPRHIAVAANGDVYVTLRSGQSQLEATAQSGGIVALRDTDNDGIADVIRRFGRSDADTGMAIRDGVLYYSSVSTIFALPLDNELVPTAEAEIVVADMPPSAGGHQSKPITFDRAGHLYTQAGVPSNACQQQQRTPGSPGMRPCPFLEQHGGVRRFSATSRNQIYSEDGIRYSTGHRNVVALEWNDAADALYLVMHGRDQLDQLWPGHYTEADRIELPAEEFHRVDQGDDLGWPYSYYDQRRSQRMVMPEYGGDGETQVEPGLYKDPLIGFPGHWAPNDLVFYTGDQFPERYKYGAFIAFHGSWNRQPAEQGGYAVVFVPMNAAGLVTGDWEMFADDFEGPEPITSPANAAHRPSGLAVGPDGALYIGDDVGGRIWRITYRGQ
jgi:glucose/arabinose dehydrogenase